MSTHPTLVVHDTQLAQLSLGERGAAAYATDSAQVLHLFVDAPIGRPTGVPVAARVVMVATVDEPAAAERILRSAKRPSTGTPALMLLVGLASDGTRSVRAWLRVADVALPCEIMRVPAEHDLFSRAKGLLETDVLARKTVGIVGLGSGGAPIAVELAKSGVGRFVLIDPDRLELANLSRHVCGLSDLGRAKVHVVRDLLIDRNPHIAVTALPLDVLASSERATEALADVDLLIGATDDNRSRGWINRLALSLGRPAIFGRALTRAAGGDVLRVRPSSGPCLACVFSAGLDREEEISSARRAADVPAYASAADRAALIQPGLAADIAPLSNMMVRLALLELSRGTSAAINSLAEDLEADLYIWANRRERTYAGWSPMGFGSKTPSILRWYGARVERDVGCLECGEVTSSTVELAAGPPSWGDMCQGRAGGDVSSQASLASSSTAATEQP